LDDLTVGQAEERYFSAILKKRPKIKSATSEPYDDAVTIKDRRWVKEAF